ncbi:MAG TPA: ABC transporter ATP-binding protein [Vicinamibacterales bacterium]|nr:ABC transporter ATP-binding protein [Vicinamibacterales bacterium]
MSSAIIRTDQLTRAFGGIKAVDGLDLEVPAGVVFGFLGPNGAGKTTTIRLLLGLLEPSGGSARVLGYDTRTEAGAIRQRAGALLEHHGLYERLSAEDNLAFYARIWGLGAAERRNRVRELLESLGLWERRREAVGKWSRGMRQRLAVARALLHRPALLFLDEPTAGLDPVAASHLREQLAALVAREGVTVFLTTHNLAEADRLCQRVGVIKQGRLVAVGHPDELKARSATRLEIRGRAFTDALVAALSRQPGVERAALMNGRMVIDMAEAADSSPLVAMIVGSGAAVDEVRRDKSSLEDVFLTLMEEDR